MLTLTEAVIIRRHNDVAAYYEAALQSLRIQLANEKAARARERAAGEVQISAMHQRMLVLEEMIVEGG